MCFLLLDHHSVFLFFLFYSQPKPHMFTRAGPYGTVVLVRTCLRFSPSEWGHFDVLVCPCMHFLHESAFSEWHMSANPYRAALTFAVISLGSYAVNIIIIIFFFSLPLPLPLFHHFFSLSVFLSLSYPRPLWLNPSRWWIWFSASHSLVCSFTYTVIAGHC